ncbi:F-box protein At5g07610-like [Papaver somniferum]|uniref:F-box protein At5g07610-like n=1 Tax=Papaver somniferum TaxID=3469 RepID=UPI000E6F9CCB|nr:F-box protein At5g07610-like [Papaver somniferum]
MDLNVKSSSLESTVHSFSTPRKKNHSIWLYKQSSEYVTVKSLFLFKSVSKQWFSLISDPYFVHSYSLQRRLSVQGLFLHKNSFTPNPEFEFIKHTSDFSCNTTTALLEDLSCLRIEQSCNGLLCCRNYKQMSFAAAAIDGFDSGCCYYLSSIAGSVIRMVAVTIMAVMMNTGDAFDPIKSRYYEVVHVLRYSGAEVLYQIEIYNSKTSSWRLSGDLFAKPDDLKFYKSGVYWNGSLHWISSSAEYLRCFDVGGEVLKEIYVPPMTSGKGRGKGKVSYFGEYKGHLHLIFEYDITSNPCFDILEMDTDYKCWNIKYHVNLEVFLEGFSTNGLMHIST